MAALSSIPDCDNPIPTAENEFVIRRQVKSAFGQTCREVRFEPTNACSVLNLMPRVFLQNSQSLFDDLITIVKKEGIQVKISSSLVVHVIISRRGKEQSELRCVKTHAVILDCIDFDNLSDILINDIFESFENERFYFGDTWWIERVAYLELSLVRTSLRGSTYPS